MRVPGPLEIRREPRQDRLRHQVHERGEVDGDRVLGDAANGEIYVSIYVYFTEEERTVN